MRRSIFFALFSGRRPPPNSKTAWQTSLQQFFVCRLIARKSRVSGLCGDCVALLGFACGAHARRFSAFGSGLIWYFSSPVLRWGHRKSPAFALSGILRVSSEKTILSGILRKILRSANFGDTGILREKSSDARVPDSPNGEKCARFFAHSELPVSPFRI